MFVSNPTLANNAHLQDVRLCGNILMNLFRRQSVAEAMLQVLGADSVPLRRARS
jgi:hypothetical protein